MAEFVLGIGLFIVFSGLMMAVRIYIIRRNKFDLIIHDNDENDRVVHKHLSDWVKQVNFSSTVKQSDESVNFTFQYPKQIEELRERSKISELQNRLTAALYIEDYEAAIEIRDTLKILTAKNKPDAHS